MATAVVLAMGHMNPCLCLRTLAVWGQLLSLGMNIGSKGFLTRANSFLLFPDWLLVTLYLGVKSKF